LHCILPRSFSHSLKATSSQFKFVAEHDDAPAPAEQPLTTNDDEGTVLSDPSSLASSKSTPRRGPTQLPKRTSKPISKAVSADVVVSPSEDQRFSSTEQPADSPFSPVYGESAADDRPLNNAAWTSSDRFSDNGEVPQNARPAALSKTALKRVHKKTPVQTKHQYNQSPAQPPTPQPEPPLSEHEALNGEPAAFETPVDSYPPLEDGVSADAADPVMGDSPVAATPEPEYAIALEFILV
jgi:hypothetical protein